MENNEKEVLFSVSHLKKIFSGRKPCDLKRPWMMSPSKFTRVRHLEWLASPDVERQRAVPYLHRYLYDKTDGQVLYKGTDVHALNGKERFAFKNRYRWSFRIRMDRLTRV